MAMGAKSGGRRGGSRGGVLAMSALLVGLVDGKVKNTGRTRTEAQWRSSTQYAGRLRVLATALYRRRNQAMMQRHVTRHMDV